MDPSARLTYQKFTESDREFSITLSMDETIMKYVTGKALSHSEAQKRFDYQLKVNIQTSNLGFYKAIDILSQKIVGYVKIVKDTAETMEIGYAVLADFRGMGYADEMTSAMIAHTENNFPEVSKLLGTVQKENSVSAHILQKHGFSVEKEEVIENRIVIHYTKWIEK